MKRRILVSVLSLLSLLSWPEPTAAVQMRRSAGASALKQQVERLRVVGSVLMIAAHPDDENTAVLTWCAQDRKLRTGYLSLTRGEGGQNLIGSEQGALLGVIRTQELLAARRVDGAEQFFTRAIDFGFSKTADETMRKWGREEVLSDVVRVIRTFRPDVIILRFSGTPRDGHGHHQTSAILGKEAFRAAADPARFPEQLKALRPWQAKRAVWNGFAFNRQQEAELEKLQQRVMVDTGAYNPVLGVSYGELAGLSRSQHRSQGMGAPERRGAAPNYFIVVDGDPATADLFEGIDLSWNRLPGGAAVGRLLDEAAASLDIAKPHAILPLLAKARALASRIDHDDARRKVKEIDEAIASAAGLWLDVAASRNEAAPGAVVSLSLTALNRSPAAVKLASVALEGIPGVPAFTPGSGALEENKPLTGETKFTVPADFPASQPFWLREKNDGLLYRVPSPEWIGPAENPPVLQARFRLEVEGQAVELVRPVENRYVDRVRGEVTRPFVIVPALTVELSQAALVFPDARPKTVEVGVLAHNGRHQGALSLKAPSGWKVEPASCPFVVESGAPEFRAHFTVTPPAGASRGHLEAIAESAGAKFGSGYVKLDYEHIPPQVLLPIASAPLTRADMRVSARRIGYIMGAGDEVPEALRQMGCEVTILDPAAIASGDYARFDAVVTGVRAWNTRPDLRVHQKKLWDWVEQGGIAVVQYNVMDGLFWSSEPGTLRGVGPYPFKISRERVTVEEAPVKLLKPDHALLNVPNRITAEDFAGWVQERGLYFPTEVDPKYEALLEIADPGEKPLNGGILTVRHGKGVYVFTPLAFFRQLPAGVPGAYRLFANLVSAGQSARQ